ncbi:MAG: ABC transporter ATP-binding protein [uncultured bacterium]|nr:MAG: ABC transporter ATP-binding protein [uncultured bacterium]
MKTLKSELLRTLDVTKWVLSIYFKNYPLYTTIFIITELVLTLSNLLNAYIIALVTDRAIQVAQVGISKITDFLPIITLIIGSYIFFETIRIINIYVWRIISYQDMFLLRRMLAERLSFLGIQNLENPEITNKSQRFNEEINNISGNMQMVVSIFSSFFAFVSAGIVLINTIPVVALLFTVVMIFQLVVNQKFIRELWVVNRDSTEERRKTYNSLNLLSEPAPLKELLLSQGRSYLSNKVNIYIDWIVGKISNIRKNWSLWQFVNKLLDSAVFGYGIVVILQRLVGKIISIGQLTFEIRSLRIFADSFSNFTGNIVGLRENTVRIGDVKELFAKYESEKDGEFKLQNNTPLIDLKNVSFKYPNTDKLIFKGIDLNIKPGEKIAIVGENGAGKTTLVKLICRIYRVSGGVINLNNINIDEIKISTWHKNLAILFQDYNQYTNLTVKENIEVDSSDRVSNKESITEALKKADALNFVEKYKNGIDQILSERYKDGIRPSTGQWQKIAIARVFHRDSPVLILDEPTASIDAVAEAQIFDNIYKFAKNKTVIIISHRFSTVRNADRIIVLDKGKIVEQGSHEELLKNDGKYAQAFKLQAKGYQ